MELVRDPKEMQGIGLALRRQGLVLGFVPTMGYLHEGHLSLVRAARRECDRVAVSIFVNPLQFGPKEDYDIYPRDLERDLSLLEKEGVAYAFVPSEEAMYPPGFSTYVEVQGTLTEKMCARSRPGHFRGVATVVLKLFQIVQPERAYFGEKDFQQALVIKKMVADLNLPVEIVTCPTVREADGLALSSRNTYLSPEEREAARALPRALQEGAARVRAGERDPEKVREAIRAVLASSPLVREDYVEVCRAEDLVDLPRLTGRVLLAAAVWVGRTRLIDNLCVEVD